MWSGPIHDKEFISNVLSHVEESEDKYGTAARMKGMLTVAKEVRTALLGSIQMFNPPSRNSIRPSTSHPRRSQAISTAYAQAWMRRRTCPCFISDPHVPNIARSSALLHAGHKVSRSHACAGSLKTTASYADIHDVFRSWVKKHPVRMDKVAENSPTTALLSKEPK